MYGNKDRIWKWVVLPRRQDGEHAGLDSRGNVKPGLQKDKNKIYL